MFKFTHTAQKAIAVLAVAGATLAATGTPAEASSVYLANGRGNAPTLFVDGSANPSDITISYSWNAHYQYGSTYSYVTWFTVRDTGADGARNPFYVSASDDCVPVDRQTVRCYGGRLGVKQIIVRTGRADDRVLIDQTARQAVTRAEVWGGGGNDTLIAQGANLSSAAGRVFLLGGDGDDRLIGSRNQEALWGGPGNDRITPGLMDRYSSTTMPDDIDGGHGEFSPYSGEPVFRYYQDNPAECVARTHGFYDRYDDSGSGAEGNDTLDVNSRDADNMTAVAGVLADLNVCRLGYFASSDVSAVLGIENVEGTDQNDRLVGDDTNNVLRPRGGYDWVSGEGANDYIDALDGSTDTVKCSSGWDSYRVDSVDTPLSCANNVIR